MVLDDLHWADQASLLLLRELASWLRDGRVLIVGAYRTVELGTSHPLLDLLAALERDGRSGRLTLGPLAPGATGALVTHLSGIPAAAVAERIHRMADGNPFFVTQVVRQLVGTGQNLGDPLLAETAWETPEGVRAVLSRRLARLRSETRAALEFAAVLGERFRYDALAAATDTDATGLAAAIEEATDAGLVREERGGYQFVHALIRQALYEGMSLPRRQRLHLGAAEAVERVEAWDLPHQAATLAVHYRLAGPAAEREKRLNWSRAAADAAIQMFAWEEAEAHLTAALPLLGATDEEQRFALLIQLGDARIRAGKLVEGQETFEIAAHSARRLGSTEKLGRAALGFPMIFEFTGDFLDRQTALLQEAIEALGCEESALRARLLGALSIAVRQKGDPGRAESLTDEAVGLARRVGTPTDLAIALYQRAGAFWHPGRAHERRTAATEALELAQRLGDEELVLLSYRRRLTACIELGDLTAADADDEAYRRIADRLCQPLHRCLRLIRLGLRTLLVGHFGAARTHIEEARDLTRRLGLPDWTGWQEMTLLREAGEFEAVETLVRDRLIVDQWPLHWRCALTWCIAEQGRMAEAREEFERLVEVDLDRIPRGSPWYVSIGFLIETCALLGDKSRAETLYDLFLPYAEVTISMLGQVVCYGSAERFLGLLAAAMGRSDDAERHFETALERNTRMNARPWVAHTLHDHAVMLLARGGRRGSADARGMLERAASLYDELGMEYWAERARTLLAGSTPAATAAPDGLTAREAEVLRLLAAGQSNREIAEVLVLSVRTVEKHIEMIYSKIGARKRADAAVYAAHHGLDGAAAER